MDHGDAVRGVVVVGGAAEQLAVDAALDSDTNADRVSTGQVVVHNGVGPADPMDALLGGAGAADALTRP